MASVPSDLVELWAPFPDEKSTEVRDDIEADDGLTEEDQSPLLLPPLFDLPPSTPIVGALRMSFLRRRLPLSVVMLRVMCFRLRALPKTHKPSRVASPPQTLPGHR